MARVFCHVTHHPKRVTVVWSEGAASFEPYHLAGQELEQLQQAARQARAQLEHVLGKDLASAEDQLAVAQAGHRLFHVLFRLDSGESAVAREVLDWLRALQEQNAVESLEIVSNAPGRIPWQLMIDVEPTADALRAGHFWGSRYNLAVGHRVNPLRYAALPDTPTVLVLADPAALNTAWTQWAQDRQAAVASDLGHAESLIADLAPDVVVLLAPIHGGAFKLAGRSLGVEDLQALLDRGNPHPLLVVHPHANPPAATWEPLLFELADRLPGLVTCEVPLSGDAEGEFYRTVLGEWLTDRKPIGEVVRAARQRQGWTGLAVSAYCPANLRFPAPGEMVAEPLPPLELPDEPYRPLRAFDRDDRALFTGRELDVFRVAALFDQADGRGVLLHGPSGCGKTSLLQAGVFPFLEEEALGFRVLRNRLPGDSPLTELEGPVLAIRPGGDLSGQFAQVLAAFAAQPLSYITPTGRTVIVDLPTLLTKASANEDLSAAIQASAPMAITEAGAAVASLVRQDSPSTAEGETSPALRVYRALITGDEDALADLVERLTRELPFALVLWIEQGEELITQEDTQRAHSLRLVQRLVASSANCRVVLSLRTDFLGRFLNLLPTSSVAQWHECFLPALTASQMEDVLLVPTVDEPLPRCAEIPARKYGFTFEPALAPNLLRQADSLGLQGPWALANLQALCSDLVARIRQRKETLVRTGDVKDLKGPAGALIRHIDARLRQLPVSAKDRITLRTLLLRLSRPQADGAPLRQLLSDAEAVALWRGAPGAEAAIAAAEEANLLEVHQLLVDGEERLFVGLPQDSLARAAAEIAQEKQVHAYAKTKVADFLWIAIPLLLLACVITWVVTRRSITSGGIPAEQVRTHLDRVEKEIREEARLPLFNAALAQAQQALAAGDALRARQLLLGLQPFKADQLDLRGFDWHLLWKQINGERKTLVGHQAPLLATAIAPDGKILASASGNGVIKLWNLESGLEIAQLKGHKDAVNAVAFAPDGKTLASAGTDKVIRLWDMPAASKELQVIEKERKALSGHTDAVHALAFGKDPNTLASAGADRTVIVWNVEKAKEETVLKDHAAQVNAVAYSPDGKLLASAAEDGQVLIREVAGQKVQQTLTASGPVRALAFNHDGTALVTGGSETGAGISQGAARVWDSATGKLVAGPFTHGAAVLQVAFTDDGKTLATSGKDFGVRFWNLKTGQVDNTLLGHYGWVSAMAWSRDGAILVTGSHDQTVKVWDTAAMHNPSVLSAGDAVTSLAYSGKGDLLASGHPDGSVKLWDAKSRKLLKTATGHVGMVRGVAFTNGADAPKLAVASASAKHDEGEVKLYDVKGTAKEGYELKLLHTLKQHGGGVLCLAFADNDQTLATGGADKTAILWEVNDGKARKVLSGHKQPVTALAFSERGHAIVTGSGRFARVWDAADGKLLHDALEVQAGDIHTINLEAAHTVISAGADHAVNVWSWMDSGPTLRLTVRPHTQPIAALAVFPKDKLVTFATASFDSTIGISDNIQGERLRLRGHKGPVRALALSPDGQTLASGGQDGTIRLWRAAAPTKGN